MQVLRIIAVAAVSLFLAFISACQSGPAVEVQIQGAAVDLHTEVGKVAVIKPESRVVGSANAIRVSSLKTITETSKLVVEATLTNERGRRDILYYRLRWLDGTGVMLGQYEPWSTEAIEGFQQAVITITSPYPMAADFRLEIRARD